MFWRAFRATSRASLRRGVPCLLVQREFERAIGVFLDINKELGYTEFCLGRPPWLGLFVPTHPAGAAGLTESGSTRRGKCATLIRISYCPAAVRVRAWVTPHRREFVRDSRGARRGSAGFRDRAALPMRLAGSNSRGAKMKPKLQIRSTVSAFLTS